MPCSTCVPETGFAVHWIDLDKFKEINDEPGHPVGDELLRSVVGSLREAVREGDLVARLGGDEFAVIQPGATTVAEAEKMTRRLLAAIRAPRHVLGHDLTIGASIGVVLAPQHGATAEELMRNVDLALYSAKAAGRGTFAVFEPGRDTRAGASALQRCGVALTARIVERLPAAHLFTAMR